MAYELPEKDWKIFREIQRAALDRFCGRVLDDIEAVRSDVSRTHHERYLTIYSLLQRRDKRLGEAFDNPRRSQMLWQLELMWSRGLINEEEMSRFSEETRSYIAFLTTKS